MKEFLFLILIAFVGESCQSNKSDQSENTSLQFSSDSLASLGYTPLISRNTLNGWRIFKNKPNNSWEAIDGILHCKPFDDFGQNQRADIITNDQYESFELVFQWKASYQSNSGVMFRVSEEFDETYATGPEYQVLDDEEYPGEVKAEHLSSGCFGLYAPENNSLKPVGEWNDSKIVVNGNHVEHWLNGTKTVDYELYSEDWTKRMSASKWKEFPGYASLKKGHIALQDHGNEVWYRNIGIKILD